MVIEPIIEVNNSEMCSIDVPLLSVEEDDLSFENTISKPIKENDF